MTDNYTLTVDRYDTTDPRLGRHVEHDERSRAYALDEAPRLSALRTVRWRRRVPVFDQGRIGSCTGNAAAGLVGTDRQGRQGRTDVDISVAASDATHGLVKAGPWKVDEQFAVMLYELATRLDRFPGHYPPDDTGSSGLAVAKALRLLRLADSYRHAFSVNALAAALQSAPVMVGIVWLNSMFDPKPDGFLTVDESSGVAGGHEIEVVGYDADEGVFTLVNSWGESWGDHGTARVGWADMQWLLRQHGDVTLPCLL